MHAYHGPPVSRLNGLSRPDFDLCYPDESPEAETTYYSDCPESFTAAATLGGEYEFYGSTMNRDEGVAVTTICCPEYVCLPADRSKGRKENGRGGEEPRMFRRTC